MDRSTIGTVAAMALIAGYSSQPRVFESHKSRGRRIIDREPEIPIDQNHPLVIKALNTFKYRIQNKVSRFVKFHKRPMDNEEAKALIHKTVSELGNSLPNKELCNIFYSMVAEVLGYQEDEQHEEENKETC